MLALDQPVPGRRCPRVGVEQLAGRRRHLGVGTELAGRVDRGGVERIFGALSGDRKDPEVVDDLTPQVDPDRVIGLGRENIDDPSSDGELTPAFHSIRAVVSEVGEAAGEVGRVCLSTTGYDHWGWGGRGGTLG